MESETHDKKLDAAMENLVVVMSSDKSQVKTLLTMNAQLAKQISEKDATITRLTKEISNLVNITTKTVGKITTLTTATAITMPEKYHLTGRGKKIQTIPHSIQMDTAGHTVIVEILITAVKTASTRRRDTKQKQLMQTQWEGRTRTKIGSKDYGDSDQGIKIKRD